jgi:hypothetical protein
MAPLVSGVGCSLFLGTKCVPVYRALYWRGSHWRMGRVGWFLVAQSVAMAVIHIGTREVWFGVV